MDIDKIAVNTMTLATSRDNVQQQVSLILKKLESMRDAVLELNNMWDGSANDAFNKVFDDDIKFLLTICGNMQKLISYESTAVKEYNECEIKVQELIQGIKV